VFFDSVLDTINKVMPHIQIRNRNHGGIIIQVIAFVAISTVILSGFVGWGALSMHAAKKTEVKEQAIQIAEAGIDYYRWHLAHAPTDYQDGTATSGPYVHDYSNKEGVKIGSYSLKITPPLLGSTLVTIESTGRMDTDLTATRTIRAKLAKPSFAKYSVISNTDLSIGADIYGPMHSNGGIYFVSGTAYNLITSSMTTFNSTTTGGVTKWGVYAGSDPNPPTAFTSVTAMFTAGRQVGVPAVDFAGITVDLGQLEADAVANGRYYGVSGGLGYHIVLQTNDTFDIYRVDTAATGGATCESRQWWTYPSCPIIANAKWSVGTQTLIGNDVAFPANGIIFAEDHVWIDGQVNTARLSIIAATIPDVGTRRNIIVNNDLLYTNYDGQDVIGLIAQDNFWVGVVSEDDLRIDAAIIAQNGRVSRYAYRNCGVNSVQTTITFYGMFASNQRYAYGNLGAGCSPSIGLSGYNTNRVYIYDPFLLYGPPPSFPLTADQYQVISWEEI
jgi:hypothetical protein